MRDSSAHVHPTVKPDQLRRDEVRFVLQGDDLHDQLTAEETEAFKLAVLDLANARYGLDVDEIDVELGREPK